MAAKAASSFEDDEIIFQKQMQNTYIGSVHDRKTGSMMPVMLQTEVDGTRSKVPGFAMSHGTLMGGGDGKVCEKPVTQLTSKKSVSGSKKKKVLNKFDSKVEIVNSISGSEPNSKSLTEKWQRVVVERSHLEVDANINSSENDLDIDLDDENKW